MVLHMPQRQELATPDKLLTVQQVAELLTVSTRTVQRYVADGRLTAVTLPAGRGLRFRPADIQHLLGGAA